jgi:hypothetical protein
VYAYDPDKGLYNPNVEITFRGQRLNPIKLQVTEISWGVTADYTVAYRTAAGVWIDLTDYIETSDAGTYVTVGGFDRALTSSGEPVGSRPNADTSTPAQPVFVTPFAGSAYLDSRGYTRARVVLSWNAPNNVDGTSVLDGDHYEIRYAVDTDMLYPATWSQSLPGPLAGLADVGAAVRRAGPASGSPWSSTGTRHRPAAGPVARGRLRRADPRRRQDRQHRRLVADDDVRRVLGQHPPVHAGRAVGGRVADRRADHAHTRQEQRRHVQPGVGPRPPRSPRLLRAGFTPDITTLAGKVASDAGMIQAQIPVVVHRAGRGDLRPVRPVVAVDKTGNKSGPSDAATATALLIDDAHISDLTVSKVTAGTISADFIVGARIKTADTGARVELNSGGIGAWNAAGQQTVAIAGADGSVTIVGQLKSGTSGKRIEINPTSTYLPEIRWYANTGTDYGYINAVSSGTDVTLGMNSSPSTTRAWRSSPAPTSVRPSPNWPSSALTTRQGAAAMSGRSLQR